MVLKKRWLIVSFIAVVSVLLLSYYFQILSITILVAHWAIIIGLSLRVIARRLTVGVSLAWLAITFSIPFAGAAIYLIFGDRRLDRPRIARQSAAKPVYDSALAMMRDSMAAVHPNPDSPGISLYRQALNLLGVPALKGNRMILLRDYAAVFDAWVQDIDSARKSCRLAFYILFEGGRADDVVKALIRACGRGVSCRLLVDAMGSKRFLGGKTVHALRKAGVRIAQFRNGLLHIKSMVVDDALCLFGSVNLDMRSFWLDFEDSLFVYEKAFATMIFDLQQEYLSQSDYLDAEKWRQRSTRRRFLENTIRLLSPLL